jgi:septum formation protein
MPNIVLASASQRRVELLAQLGYSVSQQPADIDETPLAGEAAGDYVRRLAGSKAQSVPCNPDDLVLAADTTIEIDGNIIGKPSGFDHFAQIFDQLSDARHTVRTGVAVRQGARVEVAECITHVWMRAITLAERKAYWQSGEPQGKAGGYAIQGLAAAFISRIDGSYTNVVGLPLFETAGLLEQFGVCFADGCEPSDPTRER